MTGERKEEIIKILKMHKCLDQKISNFLSRARRELRGDQYFLFCLTIGQASTRTNSVMIAEELTDLVYELQNG